ncbi:MAG TPA: DUF11 domain-containing protein [Rubrobacteraceae bacterium]|nr:DUF11 domain-containing protein [Rubrobacteraceae bacterium]
MRRSALLFALVGVGLILAAGTAQAQSASLEMTAAPERIVPGEPVTFTITKTNLLPSDLEWSVRDFLPAGAEFVSATYSQGSCALVSREELGVPYNPTNGYDSDVVHCDLGVIPSGESVTIDVTVTSTTPGEITNYAADTGESQASATVEVVEHP